MLHSHPLRSDARRFCATLALSAPLLLAPLAWAQSGASATVTPPTPGTAKLSGLPPAGADKFQEIAATPALVKSLKHGGYTLYLRHGPTDNTKADRVPSVDLNDCSTQRPLTEAGRKLMASVGEGIRKAQIPIGEFRVSPLCRAKESAAAALPRLTPTVDKQLMYVANFTDADKAPIIANTRQLLSSAPNQGSNRLLLAHAPNLMDLMGYFPKEGTLVIFRPKGDGFDYLGSIPPTLWPSLQP